MAAVLVTVVIDVGAVGLTVNRFAEKVTPVGLWTTTIATAGSHTITLQATTAANVTAQVHSALKVTVYEIAAADDCKP